MGLNTFEIMNPKLILVCFLALFFIAPAAFAAPEKVPDFGRMGYDFRNPNSRRHKEIIKRLDSFYAAEVAKGFNGSVLIGYRGRIVYERYFGYSNREKGIKWSEKTNSQLASTSKPFTSAAILALSDKGLLDIDDQVKKYIPEFPYSQITVRMLLNHRSGLKDYIKFAAASPDKPYLNNEDIVNLFATKQPSLYFPSNTNFKYSNSNYAILASIVERVSGMRFKYFVERFIFKKLGMTNTEIHDPNLPTKTNKALSYKAGWKHYKDMHHDGVYGDKGVYSCVRDLYKWDQALYSNKLLKWTTLKAAYKPYSFEKPSQKNYGLGWRMIHYPAENMRVVYHNGWWHGNNTAFYRFLNDNFTIIVLGNKYNTKIYKQPEKIFRIISPREKAVLFEDQNNG